MTLQPVNELPDATIAVASDTVILVQGGTYKKTTVSGLKTGFSVATSVASGLMSAADKSNLDAYGEQIASVVAPSSTTIASSSVIAISDPSKYTYTLTGTTGVNTITGLTPRVKYSFSYPSGAGLTFLGEPMIAGDVFEVIDV